jgi:hypothetical protein
MSGEMRRLSTGATTFWKSVFTPTWIAGAGAFTAAVWMDLIGSTPNTVPMRIAVLLAWVAFSSFLLWWGRRMTHVWLDGDEIVLRPGGREYRLLLSQIRGIKETRFQRVKLITLDLGRPTPVGDSVVFVAPFAFQTPFGDHPLVAELKERKERLRAGGDGNRLLH